jgi:hypothetical protein
MADDRAVAGRRTASGRSRLSTLRCVSSPNTVVTFRRLLLLHLCPTVAPLADPRVGALRSTSVQNAEG